MVALITLLGTACGGVSERAETLDTITRAYEKHLRWGKFDEAQVFRKGEQHFLTNSERRRLQNIRVTGYDILSTQFSADQSTAEMMVRIRYFNDEYAIEKTFIDRQKWEYDKASGNWFLVTPIPSFR
jgi:hypothetical protein